MAPEGAKEGVVMGDRAVTLTDEEIVLLDGKVSASVQEKVDVAKRRLASQAAMAGVDPRIAKFVSDVVSEATTKGLILYQYWPIRSCGLCDRRAGYAMHARSGRYHRKGEPNHDKPLFLKGRELSRRFIVSRGYVGLGCCDECFERARPHVVAALEPIRAEVAQDITGHAPRWKKARVMECECGWRGHEFKMKGRRTLMGDGMYPAVCPQCGAENMLFVNKMKATGEYEVIPAEEAVLKW